MILIVIVIFLLVLLAISGLLYASFVHKTLTKEFKEKEWMDNSEYDYGHDVHHNNDVNIF